MVKIPTDLQIANVTDSYCGTVVADGKVGICYISPSYNGYLSPCYISDVAVGTQIKIFGSYYTN